MRLATGVAAALAAVAASKARAQGIGTQAGLAATELVGAVPAIIGLATLGGGAYLLVFGVWNMYKHYTGRHHGGPTIGLAAAASVCGFIMLSLTTWAMLGSTTFTGGAPTTGSGAQVVF